MFRAILVAALCGAIPVLALLMQGCNAISSRSAAGDVAPQLEPNEDPEAMQRELESLLPRGSSIDDARNVLERYGGECDFKTDQETKRSYLRTSLERQKGFWVVQKWQIRIDFDDAGVSDINVSTGLVGP